MQRELENFGREIWERLTTYPLGSQTKRELELALLGAAVRSGLLLPRPEVVASVCNISLTRAHGYLTELALRQPPLADLEAIKQLAESLAEAEVVSDGAYLSIPLHDAALRIWLERKMAHLYLNAGDILRRDHVKLTPAGMAKLIGVSEDIIPPYDALKKLPKDFRTTEWARAAKKSWKKGIGWVDAMSVLGNTATVVQAVIPVLFRSISA